MAKVTVITNDKFNRVISWPIGSMSELANRLRDDYPMESLRTHNAIVLRDSDGYRCIVQEG